MGLASAEDSSVSSPDSTPESLSESVSHAAVMIVAHLLPAGREEWMSVVLRSTEVGTSVTVRGDEFSLEQSGAPDDAFNNMVREERRISVLSRTGTVTGRKSAGMDGCATASSASLQCSNTMELIGGRRNEAIDLKNESL